MQEIELKFLVPEARLTGLMRQAKVKSSQTTQLAAYYFDTPKQALAKAGIGLRIRLEGDVWVQTIKAGGDGIAARLEHNTVLDAELVQTMLDDNNLLPDLSLYQDTSIASSLADFKMQKLAKKLTCQYVTDVQRTTRLLKDTAKSEMSENSIEVAYDYGKIIHGEDETQFQQIQEIEFELLSGEVAFLFSVAKVWCKRYKLYLSTVTKAERGGLLLKGVDYSPAVSANLALLNVNKESTTAEFIRAAVHNCLLQILPNSSAIVAGSMDNEHILQLCIGIRRLHTALKAFKKFSEMLNPEWLPILEQTERLLSNYRETAYLVSNIQPELQQSGASKVDWSTELARLKVTPINAIRANDFQLTLLELIEFTMSDANAEPQADKLALDKVAKILSKAHSKLLKAMDHLDNVNNDCLNNDDSGNGALSANKVDDLDQKTLQDKALDKVGNQIETLLAISEFSAPLYNNKKHANKKSKRLIKRLSKALKAVEQYQEHEHYQQRYQHKIKADNNALYGAGWFAALAKSDSKRSKKRLEKVRDSATFW